MINKFIWPSNTIPVVWRVTFVSFLVIVFGALLLVKYIYSGANKQLSLNCIVFAYTLISSYGFLFDRDIPAPPFTGSFDKNDINLQCVRLTAFLVSLLALVLITILM
ncbi:hypothetical protein CWE12_12900 [Aliidiomarina sedimenti]|uniref:Uncharacterized protein n=1 Tax=Aliidiomarina sedimenti TaxID=1933879 RepID=A0ABY0BVM8_9GAMM|nr:hypothetical protein CWE12_12900 [Aliidiomarina sedimenti]